MSEASMTSPESPTPRVSVVMCVYNGEDFLHESVESILNQTFADFELLILDDASTDATAQILSECAARDRRIGLAKNEQNIGLTKSLNKCLAMARGEYVARQDADDISAPDRLARQVDALEAQPELTALGAWVEVIDESGVTQAFRRLPIDHEALQESLLFANIFCHSSLMARRSALEDIGGYNEQLRYAQDHDLWWRLGTKGRLAVLPELLVKWRNCANLSREHQAEQRRDVCGSCWAFVKSRLGKATEREEAAFRRFWHSFRHREGSIQAGDIKRLAKVWKLLQPKDKGEKAHGAELRGADYWMWRFVHFIKHLLLNGRFGEAAAMLAFLRKEAGLSRWVAFGRLVVVFAPPLGLGLGKRLWGEKR